MSEGERSARSRATEAFRALDEGGDLAKRRVWRRVEQGLSEDRAQRRRRLGWMAGIAASAVAALAFVLPPALGTARSWYEPSRQEQQRVAVNAVMEMLNKHVATGATSGDTTDIENLAQYLVTEAHAGGE